MTYLMSFESFPPLKASSVSNRPFAHCCQIFREQISPCALHFTGGKRKFLASFALLCAKDILVNLFRPVKPFIALTNYSA